MAHQTPNAPESTPIAAAPALRRSTGRGLWGAIDDFRAAYSQVVAADIALSGTSDPENVPTSPSAPPEANEEGQASNPSKKTYEVADFAVATAKSRKAYKAWKDGKLMAEDFKDLVDQWLDAFNFEKFRLGWAMVPAKLSMDAAGWLLKKVVKLPGRVHDMEGLTIHNIGEMLLSENRKRDKKKSTELHVDEMESLCHTLGKAALSHAFRRFVKNTPAKIQIALKSDSGKEEMRKEIQELLFLDSPVLLDEMEEQVKKILELLGGSSPPTIRKELQENFDLIRSIYENMELLLTEDVLAELYGYAEAKEEVNYDAIGDQIGRLKDEAAIVKFITAFDLDTLRRKTINLTDTNSIRAEASSDPEGLKAEIQNLFDISGRPTLTKVNERSQSLRRQLKEGEDVSGLTTGAAGTDKRRLDLIAYIKTCEKALDDANALDELSGTATSINHDEPVEALRGARILAEAEEASTKEKTRQVVVDYVNFGKQISTLSIDEIPAYLKAFRPFTFNAEFPWITGSLSVRDAKTNMADIRAEILRFSGRRTWTTITEVAITTMIQHLQLLFIQHVQDEMAGYLAFQTCLDQVKNTLSGKVLKALS